MLKLFAPSIEEEKHPTKLDEYRKMAEEYFYYLPQCYSEQVAVSLMCILESRQNE